MRYLTGLTERYVENAFPIDERCQLAGGIDKYILFMNITMMKRKVLEVIVSWGEKLWQELPLDQHSSLAYSATFFAWQSRPKLSLRPNLGKAQPYASPRLFNQPASPLDVACQSIHDFMMNDFPYMSLHSPKYVYYCNLSQPSLHALIP